jgi:hypothetical protein
MIGLNDRSSGSESTRNRIAKMEDEADCPVEVVAVLRSSDS